MFNHLCHIKMWFQATKERMVIKKWYFKSRTSALHACIAFSFVRKENKAAFVGCVKRPLCPPWGRGHRGRPPTLFWPPCCVDADKQKHKAAAGTLCSSTLMCPASFSWKRSSYCKDCRAQACRRNDRSSVPTLTKLLGFAFFFFLNLSTITKNFEMPAEYFTNDPFSHLCAKTTLNSSNLHQLLTLFLFAPSTPVNWDENLQKYLQWYIQCKNSFQTFFRI